MSFITAIDSAIVMFIYNHLRCGFLDVVMRFITNLGNKGIIWIIIAVILLLSGKKMRYAAFTLLLSLVISLVLCSVIIKPLVARIRPYDLLDLQITVKALHDYSFPSGHTSAACAAAVSVFIYNKKVGTALTVLAALMALSRLYLMVHFPTDVIAGAFIGVFSALISNLIIKKITEKRPPGINP